MRILMLGNSLTTQNDLPSLLAKMAKSEVLALAEDDAHLKDFLDAKSKLGRKFSRTLKKGPWD